MRRTLTILITMLIGSQLIGCKSSKPTGKTTFTDDMSNYRIAINPANNIASSDIDSSSTTMLSWSSLESSYSVNDSIQATVQQIALANTIIESFPGYRIQVYSASSRENALEIIKYLEEELKIKDPIYLHYEQPNFKVKIGDYTNRIRAYEVHATLKTEYPYSIIIRDDIKLYIHETQEEKDTDKN